MSVKDTGDQVHSSCGHSGPNGGLSTDSPQQQGKMKLTDRAETEYDQVAEGRSVVTRSWKGRAGVGCKRVERKGGGGWEVGNGSAPRLIYGGSQRHAFVKLTRLRRGS